MNILITWLFERASLKAVGYGGAEGGEEERGRLNYGSMGRGLWMHTARERGKLFRRLLVVISLMYTGAIKAFIFQHQLLLSSLRVLPQAS
jgi:hypothetical protein